MRTIIYRIRLLEPLLVTQVQSGEENSAIGLRFVPGSTLRGAFVDRYRRLFSVPDLAADPIARRLFFTGDVCFLHAYPWHKETRFVPTPLSWMTEKDEAASKAPQVFDWAVDDTRPLNLPKPVKERFASLGEDPVLYTPSVVSTVHIGLKKVDVRGKGNAVYRYDALPAGEVLAAAVVVQEDADVAVLEQLITPGDVMLGGARLAGYGRAVIEGVQVKRQWRETEVDGEMARDEVIVTLLSDAIVRGAGGQIDGDLTSALETALQAPPGSLKVNRSYQRLQPIGGYNRKWSLPLPQAWAIQAGSVFVYEAASINLMKLQELAQRGVGERRAEGYGRFAVNAQTIASFQGSAPVHIAPTAAELSDSSKDLARRMADRRLELLLERELTALVNRIKFSGTPSNAQLSRVRKAAQQAQYVGTLEPITNLLADLKPAQLRDFEKARLRSHSNVTLLQWIRERAEQRDIDVQLIHGKPLPVVAGERAALTDEQRVNYTARLIDGVMKKATKVNQRREEDQ